MRRLAVRLYALSACDDGVLLYPVYALLFADAGVSAGQISSLFVIWSVTVFVLEIPSGAWADAYSRRRLLALGRPAPRGGLHALAGLAVVPGLRRRLRAVGHRQRAGVRAPARR